jgi:branched-chain amino acid transport system substrate-binding protein
MVKYKNDDFHKEHVKLMGIDEVNAREVGSKLVAAKSHYWQSWENMFALKQAIEMSGYKTKKDTQGVILALEGMQMKNSAGFPQGDKILRKEDHSGIIDCYISRVENGKMEVKKRVPKEEIAKFMPVRHHLSKMPI